MGVPFTSGELTTQQARHLNEITRTVEQFSRLSVAPPLSLTRPAGIPSIRLTGDVLDSDLLLAEVVSSTGTPPVHTVKLKTRKITSVINTVVDVTPTVTVTQVLNPLEAAWPAGTLVAIFPIPEYEDWWWGIPIAADNGGGGDDDTDCTGHGWLIHAQALEDGAATNDPKRTLSVVIAAGVGECACIDRQPGILAVPNFYTAIFSTDTGKWHVLDMIDTCCSCAWMDIEIPVRDGRVADEDPLTTVTLDLVSSCDDSIHETYYFRRQCENEECFEIAGHGPMLCTDTPDPIPCDNTFRAEICCAVCTLANVPCGVCCGCEAPPYWTILGAGFSGALSYLNRFLAIPFTSECVWGISCDGLTIGLGIAIDGSDVTFTLTIGGATYELTVTGVNTVDCAINRTLSRVSGDAGTTPATITIKPFSCEALGSSCFGAEVPDSIWIEFHDCTFDYSCMNGLIFEMEFGAGACVGPANGWLYEDATGSCMTPTERIAFCLQCGANCQWILNVDFSDSVGGLAGLVSVECDPFSMEWQFATIGPLGQAFFRITKTDPTP